MQPLNVPSPPLWCESPKTPGAQTETIRSVQQSRLVGQNLTLLELEALPTPVLLPGQSAQDWRAYVESLESEQIFASEAHALDKLAKLKPKPFRGLDDRPLIGILLHEPKQLQAGTHERVQLYIDIVEKMGCRPVLIPPVADAHLPPGQNHVAQQAMARSLDGLFGPGGADIDPALYGQPNRAAKKVNKRRDTFEMQLIQAIFAEGACFSLDICRSHQLSHVARSGTLHQDLQQEGLGTRSRVQFDYGLPPAAPFVLRNKEGRSIYEHRVKLEPNSDMAAVVGQTDLLTNAIHHQAVKDPGEELRIVGLFQDPETHQNTIEATESWNAWTVQFHPELMLDDPNMQKLVGTLGRRAHVMYLNREHRRRRRSATRVRLMGAMFEHPRARFVPADFDWLHEAWPRVQSAIA